MTQTPEQRMRNAKFARTQEARMGKADPTIKKRTKVVKKSPISPIWIIILGFVVIGGFAFELLARWFGR